MSNHVNHTSDATFEQDVLRSETPVLVDFWAPWCGPCRVLGPVVDSLADRFAGRVQVAKLNVDDNPATAQKFGIQGIPTVILFKNGEVAERIVGLVPEEHLVRLISGHAPDVATA
ncbi:MAG: thioredoxin [Thermoanaerobaculia bacterium]